MSTSALITMLVTEITITAITVYFFWKILKIPPRLESDSVPDKDNKGHR